MASSIAIATSFSIVGAILGGAFVCCKLHDLYSDHSRKFCEIKKSLYHDKVFAEAAAVWPQIDQNEFLLPSQKVDLFIARLLKGEELQKLFAKTMVPNITFHFEPLESVENGRRLGLYLYSLGLLSYTPEVFKKLQEEYKKKLC